VVWADLSVFTVRATDSDPILLIGMTTDITESKRAEAALRSSLAEKESLLKEVHHRVKNNLQIISSLFHLQDRNVQNPEVHGFLRDTQNRVRSMALLHETLYRSGDLAKVRFRHYVKSICALLARSYASDAERIRLQHDIADVTLDMDQAIPAGLIISELVTNAFKHAFLSRSRGEILVEFQTADEHHRILRVSDNGVGLPAETRPQNAETLGLLLVSSLSRQLDGRMSVRSEMGTVFEIVFPAKYPREII
jgi:two-component sensor histidine kinase